MSRRSRGPARDRRRAARGRRRVEALAGALKESDAPITRLKHGDHFESHGQNVKLPTGVAGQTISVKNNGLKPIYVHPVMEMIPSGSVEVFLNDGHSWRLVPF